MLDMLPKWKSQERKDKLFLIKREIWLFKYNNRKPLMTNWSQTKKKLMLSLRLQKHFLKRRKDSLKNSSKIPTSSFKRWKIKCRRQEKLLRSKLLSKRRKLMRQERREMQLLKLLERLMRKSTMHKLKLEKDLMLFKLNSIRNKWKQRKLSLRRLSSTFGVLDQLVYLSFTVLSLISKWLTKPLMKDLRTQWWHKLPTIMEWLIHQRTRPNYTSPIQLMDFTFSKMTRELNLSPPMIESQNWSKPWSPYLATII